MIADLNETDVDVELRNVRPVLAKESYPMCVNPLHDHRSDTDRIRTRG
jgi:hypothetical protein